MRAESGIPIKLKFLIPIAIVVLASLLVIMIAVSSGTDVRINDDRLDYAISQVPPPSARDDLSSWYIWVDSFEPDVISENLQMSVSEFYVGPTTWVSPTFEVYWLNGQFDWEKIPYGYAPETAYTAPSSEKWFVWSTTDLTWSPTPPDDWPAPYGSYVARIRTGSGLRSVTVGGELIELESAELVDGTYLHQFEFQVWWTG